MGSAADTSAKIIDTYLETKQLARDRADVNNGLLKYQEAVAEQQTLFENTNDFDNIPKAFEAFSPPAIENILKGIPSPRAKNAASIALKKEASRAKIFADGIKNKKERDFLTSSYEIGVQRARDNGEVEKADEISRGAHADGLINEAQRNRDFEINAREAAFNNAMDEAQAAAEFDKHVDAISAGMIAGSALGNAREKEGQGPGEIERIIEEHQLPPEDAERVRAVIEAKTAKEFTQAKEESDASFIDMSAEEGFDTQKYINAVVTAAATNIHGKPLLSPTEASTMTNWAKGQQSARQREKEEAEAAGFTSSREKEIKEIERKRKKTIATAHVNRIRNEIIQGEREGFPGMTRREAMAGLLIIMDDFSDDDFLSGAILKEAQTLFKEIEAKENTVVNERIAYGSSYAERFKGVMGYPSAGVSQEDMQEELEDLQEELQETTTITEATKIKEAAVDRINRIFAQRNKFDAQLKKWVQEDSAITDADLKLKIEEFVAPWAELDAFRGTVEAGRAIFQPFGAFVNKILDPQGKFKQPPGPVFGGTERQLGSPQE